VLPVVELPVVSWLAVLLSCATTVLVVCAALPEGLYVVDVTVSSTP
jgi:hypothetical protein